MNLTFQGRFLAVSAEYSRHFFTVTENGYITKGPTLKNKSKCVGSGASKSKKIAERFINRESYGEYLKKIFVEHLKLSKMIYKRTMTTS